MWIRDARFAIRQLFKSPGFAIAVILTLALGIGVNTAVFSLLNGFLLRKLPYPDPERVAALVKRVEGANAQGADDDSFDGASWQQIHDNIRSVKLASYGGSNGVNLKADAASGGAVRQVVEARVSSEYFAVLGVPLFQGRSFSDLEDRPHGPPVAVLSYSLWVSTFHSDPDLIGRSIKLKGEPYTVVGILASGAVTPGQPDLFTPLQPATTGECGGNNCGILARLETGQNWEQVNAALGRLKLAAFADLQKHRLHAWIYARPLQAQLAAGMHDRVIVLMLAVSFILLIGCANLAGLALVRLSRRRTEIAIRLALGASHMDVLRQLWSENILLALMGALGGLGLAILILDGLRGFLPDSMIPMGGFAVDSRVFAFTLSASLVTSFLFGALPALHSMKLNLRTSLSAGSRSVARGSNAIRRVLIVMQNALTMVLLMSAGLLIRTLIHLETVPSGFDSNNVITAKVSLDDARYHNSQAFDELLIKSVSALRKVPGVQAAAFALSVPYERGLNDEIRVLDGKQVGKDSGSSLTYITPQYFEAFRIPLYSGRVFRDSDNRASLPVAVVNQAFAKRFFEETTPLGRHFQMEGATFTVVGVVGNVVKAPGMEAGAPIATESLAYLPASQTPQKLANIAHIWFQPSWIVRTRRPIEGITGTIERTIEDAAPDLPLSGFSTMNDVLLKQLQVQRVEVLLLGTLSGLALLLSAIGIYALVSNLVVQRTREIGIRLALGSTAKQAILRVGSSGATSAGAGLLFGLILSVLAVRVLASEVYGVSTYDPLTLIAALLILIIVAALASFLPTLRISRIDPAETLRSE